MLLTIVRPPSHEATMLQLCIDVGKNKKGNRQNLNYKHPAHQAKRSSFDDAPVNLFGRLEYASTMP